MSVSVSRAITLISENTEKLSIEDAPLDECVGHILAENILSKTNQPPFPRSPLDGYAVRSTDIIGASADTPVKLKVVSKYYAGDHAVKPVAAGEASRIMTGSMLPEGADCVIRQEDTDYGEDTVEIRRQLGAFENYVYAGEDFKINDTLLSCSQYLDAAAVAVAAAAGHDALKVVRRARVTVISTGDELTEPGVPLMPGKIYDSNLYYIKSRLKELDAVCVNSLVMPDKLESISAAIERASHNSDLVITTGGVSVGQKDMIASALDRMNAEIVFQGVKMKPGMPTTYSKLNGARILSLSGNPFAAAVAFEVFIKPIFLAMTGSPRYNTVYKTCIADSGFGKASPGGRFIRGILTDGHVTLPKGNSNGQMFSMVGCNCLVDIKPGTGAINAGDTVQALIL